MEESKDKNAKLMMTVTKTEVISALIFGRMITSKKTQYALMEANVAKRLTTVLEFIPAGQDHGQVASANLVKIIKNVNNQMIRMLLSWLAQPLNKNMSMIMVSLSGRM